MGKTTTTVTTKEVEGKVNYSSYRCLLNIRCMAITIQRNSVSTRLLTINIGKREF